MELLPSLAITLTGIALYVLLCLARARHHRGVAFPPGPSPLPVLGNYFDIPKAFRWVRFRDLARTYGDIMSFRVMGHVLVVVNSASIARDLLEKRSAIYSSRQESVMVKLCGWDWSFAFMPYGQAWRARRRILSQHFHRGDVAKYDSHQLKGARRLLHLLLDEPEKLFEHIRYAIGITVTSATYGLATSPTGDKYIALSEEATSSFKFLLTGASLLEYLPGLADVPTWLPGTESLRRFAEIRRVVVASRDLPWADTKATMLSDTGEASDSLAASLLAELSGVGENAAESQESIYKDTVGALYGAAVDTTHATMCAFFVAMVMYPDVQERARAELEAVVGPNRLPNFADRDKLPYVNAVMKETMRWHTVSPLGLPHVSTADDEYNGLFIPKDAILLANVWSILHDPETYPDPEVFKPERFLKLGQRDAEVLDPEDIAFGFGRRICPGRHFATSTLFIYIASILHTLSISSALDRNGEPIPVELRPLDGLISYVEQFKCTIKSRSKGAEAMIQEAVAEYSRAET